MDLSNYAYDYKIFHVLQIVVSMQDCSNSSALVMELLQSCTKPLEYRDGAV